MANYQWRATAHYNGTVSPDTTLSYGSTSGQYLNWQTATVGDSNNITEGYCWHDANIAVSGMYTDANASRAVVRIQESWTTSVDDLNNLTVRITQKLVSVVRDNCYGYNQDTPGRGINIYRDNGSTLLLSLTDSLVATPHTIWDTGMTLSEYTFTLAPGQNAERSSLYVHNYTIGYPDNYDDIWVGVQFKNILPAPTTYTLSYNANGGAGAPSTQSATTAQSSKTFTVASGTPTWGLYEFLGWSRTQYSDSRTEADVEFRAGDTITLQQASPDITLYAVWRMDYRPHAILASDGKWYSHNRPGGEAHVLAGSTWHECRTIGSPTAMGNPPSVYHNGKWYNAALLGLGGT